MKKKPSKQITQMNYRKKVLLGFDPAISPLQRQRATTCAISEDTIYHLNVIDNQVNVYSSGTNF